MVGPSWAAVKFNGKGVVCRRGESSGEGPVGEAPEGGHEVEGPGPSRRNTQGGAPGRTDQQAGGVQQAVAQTFGFGVGQIALQTQAAKLGQEIAGHEHDGQPGLIDGEIGGGQVGQPGVFDVSDVALGAEVVPVVVDFEVAVPRSIPA